MAEGLKIWRINLKEQDVLLSAASSRNILTHRKERRQQK
jgi:hypothetical protein